jgi:Mrp family chromosome partitioning ATPase
MTALDQAFIKAYKEPHSRSQAKARAPTGPVAFAAKTATGAPPKVIGPAKLSVESILTALAESAGLASEAPAVAPQPKKAASAKKEISSATENTAHRNGQAGGSSASAAPLLPELRLSGCSSTRCAAGVAPAQEAVPAAPVSAKPAAPSWRPMLQVDHYIWPEICTRLGTAAVLPMDQLAEALQAIIRQGKKVIGLGACGAGEGVTTLVLAAGRSLADRGLHIALADANMANPDLAQCLGLLPQVGWEEALAGRLPLAEVVVESINDRLAVLPVRGPLAGTGVAADDAARMAAGLDTLAAHFDTVLVDLGSLEDRAVVSGALARGLGSRLDAVVLVQNVRATTPNRIADVQQCLTAAGLFQAGIIQNFVTE